MAHDISRHACALRCVYRQVMKVSTAWPVRPVGMNSVLCAVPARTPACEGGHCAACAAAVCRGRTVAPAPTWARSARMRNLPGQAYLQRLRARAAVRSRAGLRVAGENRTGLPGGGDGRDVHGPAGGVSCRAVRLAGGAATGWLSRCRTTTWPLPSERTGLCHGDAAPKAAAGRGPLCAYRRAGRLRDAEPAPPARLSCVCGARRNRLAAARLPPGHQGGQPARATGVLAAATGPLPPGQVKARCLGGRDGVS